MQAYTKELFEALLAGPNNPYLCWSMDILFDEKRYTLAATRELFEAFELFTNHLIETLYDDTEE